MKIGRSSNWYRPYYAIINNKSYRIKHIHFYQDNKVIVSSGAWLENKAGKDLEEILLPIEKIISRRKIKFDGSVFAISLGRELFDTELSTDIYIPAEMFNVHFVGYKIMYGSQVRAVFEGDQEIYITTYIKNLNTKLNEIRNEYEQIHKKVDDTSLVIYKSEEVLANIEKLKKLAEDFFAERERVRNLKIEDIEI